MKRCGALPRAGWAIARRILEAEVRNPHIPRRIERDAVSGAFETAAEIRRSGNILAPWIELDEPAAGACGFALRARIVVVVDPYEALLVDREITGAVHQIGAVLLFVKAAGDLEKQQP